MTGHHTFYHQWSSRRIQIYYSHTERDGVCGVPRDDSVNNQTIHSALHYGFIAGEQVKTKQAPDCKVDCSC
jgi:hypothetical protein